MIVYRASSCPDWLTGAQDLCIRDGSSCRYFGVCDPAYFTPPATGWVRVADGIDAAVVGSPTDYPIQRRQVVACVAGADASGNAWAIPRLLTSSGDRAFPVPIGDNWLPEPTPAQQRALDVARAARDALIADQETGGGGIDMASAAQWAAEILSFANHIHPDVLRSLRLMDEALVLDALIRSTCGGE